MDSRVARVVAIAVLVGATLAQASARVFPAAGGVSAAYSADWGVRAAETTTTPEDGYADPLHAAYTRGTFIAQPGGRRAGIAGREADRASAHV